MQDDEMESTGEKKNIGSKVTEELYQKSVTLAKMHGYNSVSEYVRDGMRRLNLFYDAYLHKQVIDVLVAQGKINPTDLMEAIYAVQQKGIK